MSETSNPPDQEPSPEPNRVNGSGLPYWVTKPKYIANCENCPWRSEADNAMGSAAQHAMRYGHRVYVDDYRTLCYCGDRFGT